MSLTDLKQRSPRWTRDLAIVATRGFGRATAGVRTEPEFVVAGTKRGGTTSLFNYLMMHPGMLGLYPRTRGQKSTDYFFRHQQLGDGWYRSNFHTRAFRAGVARRLGYPPINGEASPYYLWDPRVAAAAHRVNPDLRAVVLLRNPVDRAFSHWQERVENGVEPLSFPDALAAEEDRTAGELDRMLADPTYHSDAHDWYTYRARGVYQPQLENWLAVFPSSQLLVLRSEDMYADVPAVVGEVCDFLGLPRFELPTTKTFNASKRLPIPEDARAELERFYAPHNSRLETYLGRSLDW